ncbi:GNAT family N-acetyltransferase [Rothia nasisuis]|uniref:GNAT family N-acetyltransferase n=1 Tax=Rothia nasisuis TaxID=2109647 RepID=UPI001F01D72B|nr:GNAT family N-acetyltransferase [Rothia nasisuis]
MNFEVRPPRPNEALAWERLRIVSWRKAYTGTFTSQMFAKQEEQLEARATGFAEWLESTGGSGQDAQAQLGQRRRALVAVRLPEYESLPSLETPRPTAGSTPCLDPEIGCLLGLAFASQMPYDVQKLEMLYLLPEAFGTGVAQALMADVLDPGPAELEVLTTNVRAIRFYTKEGFTIAHTDEFAGRKTYIMRRP